MNLTILGPEKKVVDQVEIKSATIPGVEGQIQILEGHAEMIGSLETGMCSYTDLNGVTKRGVISTGFFSVKNNQLKVLAETFEYSDEINLTRAQTAQKKAEEALKNPSLDPSHFNKYQLKLQRAMIRQQLSGKSSGLDH